jgi:hypothetical protein
LPDLGEKKNLTKENQAVQYLCKTGY